MKADDMLEVQLDHREVVHALGFAARVKAGAVTMTVISAMPDGEYTYDAEVERRPAARGCSQLTATVRICRVGDVPEGWTPSVTGTTTFMSAAGIHPTRTQSSAAPPRNLRDGALFWIAVGVVFLFTLAGIVSVTTRITGWMSP